MDSYYSQPYGISSPPPYTSSATQLPVPSTVSRNAEALNGGHHPVTNLDSEPVTNLEPVDTIHTYNVKEYAFISINSHAGSTQGVPQMYLGEEATGSVVFPDYRLHEVQSIVVALRVFVSDPKNPTYTTKLVLLSEQMDSSHISNNDFCWHFGIGPPQAPAIANSPAGRSSLDSNLGFELQITIHRRGFLTRKIRMKKTIRYVTRPDPSTLFPTPAPLRLARTPRNPPLSWTKNRCPAVIVRGVIFQRIRVDVECKLIIPTSYPISDEIPLSLVMTCEQRVALDLFAISDVIDVRLLKILVFGENAATVTPPFNIANRNSYHIKSWVAKAHWDVDGHAKNLPLTDEHPRPRWSINLNGKLHREPWAEMSPSLSEAGVAHMYYVCLFPFHSDNFSPTSRPDKELFFGKISITR